MTSTAFNLPRRPLPPPRPIVLPKPRRPRRRLHALATSLTPLEEIMIRHGQYENISGARAVVPRCMTALPENFSDFLESLLPCSN